MRTRTTGPSSPLHWTDAFLPLALLFIAVALSMLSSNDDED